MLEKKIEEYLFMEVKRIGGIAYKFTSPGNAGVPDRLVIMPGGRVYFIECKKPKGSVTMVRQTMQQERLRNKGANVRQAYTIEDVRKFIEEVSR